MKNFFNDEKQSKKIFIISSFILIIAMLAFVIFYVIFSSVVEKEIKIAEIKSSIDDMEIYENTMQASTSIGKTIKQIVIENDNDNGNEKNEDKDDVVNKIAINTSNMIKNNETKNEEEEVKEEIIPDPEFAKPVEGEIIREYAKEDLVYSDTLGEWVTHLGIDIKAPKTSVVKSAEEGTIKSIKNDPRYGLTVVIEHVNGYSSVYANLLTAEFVKEGEKVKKGQTIGTVGNTGAFEIADEPHLHFEILKDGENIDPNVF